MEKIIGRRLRVAPDFAGAKMNQRNRRSYNVLDRNRQPFWNAAHRREIPAFRRFRRFSPFTLLSPKRFSAVLRSGARNTMRSIICEYTRSCARRAYSRSGRAFAAVAAFAATAATLAKSGAALNLQWRDGCRGNSSIFRKGAPTLELERISARNLPF